MADLKRVMGKELDDSDPDAVKTFAEMMKAETKMRFEAILLVIGTSSKKGLTDQKSD